MENNEYEYEVHDFGKALLKPHEYLRSTYSILIERVQIMPNQTDVSKGCKVQCLCMSHVK